MLLNLYSTHRASVITIKGSSPVLAQIQQDRICQDLFFFFFFFVDSKSQPCSCPAVDSYDILAFTYLLPPNNSVVGLYEQNV